MITFVVVTCLKDIKLFERFITSINEYWDSSTLQRLIVVVNEEKEYLPDFQQFKCSALTRWLTVEDVLGHIPKNNRLNGWHSQQQIKLVISKYVETEYFIIHDSKDFYVRNSTLSNYFDDRGLIKYHLTNDDTYRQEYKNACELVGIELPNLKLKHWTPVVVHTQTQNEMVKEYLDKLGPFLFNQLTFLYGQHGQLFTEFGLFNAYLSSKSKLLKLYSVNEINDRLKFVRHDKSLRLT